MGTPGIVLVVALLLISFEEGDAVLCHRCYSAMGGCGDEVIWRMHPWRDCGSSNFCVKVIEKVAGEEPKYIRECENELLKSTRHRLKMPNLRRHGYCLPGRKNDPSNPLQLTDSLITYCFCNEYAGCNSAPDTKTKILPFFFFSTLVTLITTQLS